MLRYHIIKQRFFSAPDGSGTGSPSANQGGAPVQQQQQESDPFSAINLDDLDPANRKEIEAAKTKFASLQQTAKAKEAEAEKHLQAARNFQSRYDQLAAQQQRQQQPDPQAERLAAVEKILVEGGLTPEVAKSQAPIFAKLQEQFSKDVKGEIGRDLAPLGASVMQSQANDAWMQAIQRDQIGALQNQEVAQKTWEGVQQLVQAGQPINAETILNLRNIHHTAFLETQMQQGNTNMPPTPPTYPQMPSMPQWGRQGFAAGNFAQLQTPANPNAPRHKLDADTQRAIDTVNKQWVGFKKGGK